ncbi:uncharacterized protein [Phyllobates terribilis]|uniref:uncharacterized protein n=1 Tax=Phyllobates terribilis TaxID=111132 RepID=UPI003CCAA995
MDHHQLRRYIQTFSLDSGPRGSQGYSRVLLQLIGHMGHGKSALVNSCKYVLDDGEFTEPARSGGKEITDGAVTLSRRSYNLTENITIVDNRGYGKMENFETVEVYTQLGNFLPLDEPVEWHKNFEFLVDRVEDMHIDTNVTDLLVPVFVYSVKTIMTEDMKGSLPTFFRNCTQLTGLSPIIVLTHRSGGNYFEVEKQFQLLGADNIVILENYTRADHIKTRQRTVDFLNFMRLVLQNVTFRMEQYMDPRRERVEHRKFLLRYIHQSVLDARKKEEETRLRRKK